MAKRDEDDAGDVDDDYNGGDGVVSAVVVWVSLSWLAEPFRNGVLIFGVFDWICPSGFQLRLGWRIDFEWRGVGTNVRVNYFVLVRVTFGFQRADRVVNVATKCVSR